MLLSLTKHSPQHTPDLNFIYLNGFQYKNKYSGIAERKAQSTNCPFCFWGEFR